MDVLFARLMAMIASALSGDGNAQPIADFMAFAAQEEPATGERKVHPSTAWFDHAWAQKREHDTSQGRFSSMSAEELRLADEEWGEWEP